MFGRRSNIRRDVALTLTQIPSRSVPASFGSPGPPRPVAPALAMRRSSGGRFAVALVSATLACLAASARAEVYLPGLISSHAGETKPRHNHHPRSRNDDNPVRNIEGGTKAVEARSEVGGGCRNIHNHFLTDARLRHP